VFDQVLIFCYVQHLHFLSTFFPTTSVSTCCGVLSQVPGSLAEKSPLHSALLAQYCAFPGTYQRERREACPKEHSASCLLKCTLSGRCKAVNNAMMAYLRQGCVLLDRRDWCRKLRAASVTSATSTAKIRTASNSPKVFGFCQAIGLAVMRSASHPY